MQIEKVVLVYPMYPNDDCSQVEGQMLSLVKWLVTALGPTYHLYADRFTLDIENNVHFTSEESGHQVYAVIQMSSGETLSDPIVREELRTLIKLEL